MGNLNQHARAIPGVRIAAASAAMGQVDEDLDALDDNVVGPLTVDAGDKPDATSIALVARVVKTLRWR